MDKNSYDFCGWATRYDMKCSDKRVIKHSAFAHMNGKTVPLVWNHNHEDISRVVGKGLLEDRPEGMYMYGFLNNTENGETAKELIAHGDITSLSIYANQLKQNGNDVVHGIIREVSLVLAGANPGAYIEQVLVHGEEDAESAHIYNPYEELVLNHSEENTEETNMKDNEPTATQEEVVAHAETETENNEETVQDVFDTLTEKQKTVVYALIGQALEDSQNENNSEDSNMKHNAFENDAPNNENSISHSDILSAIDDAKKTGSMREAFLAHGITDVENLFPEVQTVPGMPKTIDRDQAWVSTVMSGVKHTPFSRVKSMAINITAADARAKGYVKGNQKAVEVVAALKRTTSPTTVYKLQKLDRDDVLDITDFDVIAWIKQEMRGKLNEEIARAILIGDGRSSDSDDKIDPQNIRPILGDNSVYTIAKTMERAAGATDEQFAKAFIKKVIQSRKEYKGSGNPTLFCTEDLLTNMLLIEDTNGRFIYDNVEKLATTLRVSKIVTVPVFENVVRTADGYDYTLMGIVVNLTDYNVGADKGGAVTMFDDFDINFNKYEYLIETRCSGALVTPYSAITFEEKTTHVSSGDEEDEESDS